MGALCVLLGTERTPYTADVLLSAENLQNTENQYFVGMCGQSPPMTGALFS